MLHLIFSQVYKGQDKLISVAFNQVLPGLYAVSMMWTLNARLNIRADKYKSESGGMPSGDLTRNTMPRFNVSVYLFFWPFPLVELFTDAFTYPA